MTKFIQTSESRFLSTETALRNQQASIHNLEIQLGQISRLLSERPQGSLPGNTETNPREQVNAVTLRSGRTLQEKGKQESEKDAVEEEDKCQEETVEKPPLVKEFIPPLPYPARLKKDKDDEQFGKFLSLFCQLHINLPFVDALAQMPKYAKFLKDLLSNKKKLEELATVTLNEECSAILQNKMPEKLKDPGSFTLPCLIGRLIVDRALADLGTSINLMPYSIFKKLGLGEPRPTRMSIQLADRSIKYPRGIIEDVLVKVDKFIFPVDFVILDMDEDTDVPLILGRPFLATAGAIIDVRDGKLILREFLISNPLERSLVHDRGKYDMSLVTQEQWCHLEATKPLWRKRDFKVLEWKSEKQPNPSINEPPDEKLKAIVSTPHLAIKFLSERGRIVIVHADQKTARECYFTSLRLKPFHGSSRDVNIISPRLEEELDFELDPRVDEGYRYARHRPCIYLSSLISL
ncbi:uncharacterized protein LOC113870125 [Abrus precatorius]|uniref:Uncharacterized protein LOC113870125 n=1 Tax=Abrus precatorius TaxID=3816 RepID=A0A8B8M1J2_ABRPR|nr:uncharacterized protein LOC113870125 [Abrus precatorius]